MTPLEKAARAAYAVAQEETGRKSVNWDDLTHMEQTRWRIIVAEGISAYMLAGGLGKVKP